MVKNSTFLIIDRSLALKFEQYKGCERAFFFGGVLKSMLTLNEAIIDVKEG